MLSAFSLASMAQTAIIGTGGTNTGGTGTNGNPVSGYFESQRYQTVYTAAELTAAGVPAGYPINGLGFSVYQDYGGGNLLNYTIRLAHTTATNSAAHDATALTIVKNAYSYNPNVVAAGAFDMIMFDNNFVWDGTSNILVDICTGGSNPFTSPYGGVRTHAVTTGSRHIRADVSTSSCDVATTTTNGQRPQIQFSFIGPVCDGTPSPGSITGSTTPVCGSGSQTLTFSSSNVGSGLSLQWQKSVAPFDTWENMGTAATQATGTITQTTHYRVTTTCSNSGGTATSPDFVFTINSNPTVSVSPSIASICPGGTASFTASGADSYTWSPATGLDVTTGAVVNATPSTLTTYIVTGTGSNGCTATAPATVQIISLPTVTANASSNLVCAGTAINLTSTATYSTPLFSENFNNGLGAWTRTNTSTGTTPANADWTLRPSPYTLNSQTLSSNDASQFVNTNADPLGSGSTTNTTLVSPSFSTVGMTAASVSFYHYFRYNSTSDTCAVEASTDGVTWTNVQKYFGANVGTAGTWASANLPLNGFLGQPSVKLRFRFRSPWGYSWSIDNVLVSGQAAATSFSWTSDPAGFTSSAQNPTGVVVDATTTYMVSAQNSLGCSASGQVTVTVGAGSPPVATVTPGGATTFCAGGSVVLSSSVTGGCSPMTYSWSDGTNVVSTDANYTATASGTYTLTVTDNSAQVASATPVTVVVNALPTIAISPSPALYCGTTPVELTASGASTYSWSPATGLSATTGATVSATPTSVQTYTVTGTDANNCVSTGTVTVNVSTAPAVTASATPATICEGSSSQLVATIPPPPPYCTTVAFTNNVEAISLVQFAGIDNASTCAAGATAGGALQDFTAIVGNVTAGSTYPITVSGTTDGNFTTFMTAFFDWDQNGTFESVNPIGSITNTACTINATNNIVVPAGALNGNTRMRIVKNYNASPTNPCGSYGYGQAEDYTISVTGGLIPYTYAWDNAATLSASNIANPVATPLETTTYTVTVTNPAGCASTASATVTIGSPAPPTVTIEAATATTFCAGGSVVLNSSATGGCAPLTYSWSDGTNVLGTSPSLTVNASGSYTLTVTDVNLTSATSNTIEVTVVANPTISVTPSTPVICGSGSVEMTASGADTYTWSPATGLSATTGATVTATLSASQTYTVTGTNTTTTCVGSTTVSVQVSPIPTVSITPASVDQCDGTALLTANASIQSLEVVLSSINANSAAILATVPTPSGFTDGVTGTSIGDGCSDMYDTGNILGTNLGGTLAYSDNVVISSAAMGTNGRYFTRKIGSAACGSSPSMFFWAGDINGLTSLNISGNLGADGSGTQQLSTFTVSANGITYTALLKRVFGAGDPSVNQIFLIPQPNTAAQAMGTTTDNNQHDITSLGGVTRFYYVLYAGASGALINDVQAQAIAQSIVNAIPNGTISYSWSTDETTPAITVSTSGTYTVTAEANGCEGTASVVVNIAEPSEAGTDGTLTVCNVDAPVALFGSLGGTPDAGGSWTGPDAMAHSGTLDPATDAAGTYTYTVTGASPCPNVSATVEVTIGAATVWYADTDGDGYGDPNAPTADCGQPDGYVANNLDNCPADGGKRDPGVCGCGTPDTDSDGDGIADCIDSCPAVPGQIGSTCNDGDPNTIGDVLNASCTCAGTVAPPCAGNSVALVLNTDANGSQTSWEIIPQAGGAALCSGNSYASNSSITATCCLADGCYQLRVLDSFGDGMTTGGYTLVNSSNQRIIDNLNNGAGFTTVSQISGGLGFCLPIGSDHMVASSCDQMNLLSTSVLQAEPNPFVSAQWLVGNQTNDGYQFWIYDPNGSYSRRAFVSHATVNTGGPYGATRASYLNLASLITSPVPQFKVLNVRVRTMVNGVYGEYGPACRIKIDPAVECQTTQLTTVGNPSVSCGATQVPLPGGVLHANLVNGANIYQWEFSAPGYLRKITSPTRSLTLTNWVTMPLSCGTTYNVRVRASFNGGASYCAFGPSCTITTQACARPDGATSRMDEVSDGSEFSIWPNPNRGDLLNVRVDRFDVPVEQVMVDVMDMFGKRVMARAIAVDNGPLNTVLELDADLASGVYLVHVTAGEQTFVKRLVVQK